MRLLPTVVALLTSLTLLATGCGQGRSDDRTDDRAGDWTRLPDSPLSPRQGPVVAYAGGEVVVLGGYAGPPCPPNADCYYPQGAIERDGAAYDLRTGAWRPIADAPRPVPDSSPSVTVGHDVYVLARLHLLAYDTAADSWREVTRPGRFQGSALVADGSRLIVASSTDENGVHPDQILDTTTGTWSTLPADPLTPSFDRVVTPTPAGLVLTAKQILPDGSPADPAVVRAAVLAPGSGTWRTLPPSEQLGGWGWSWTGRHLVDATLGGADGGEVNNYGRTLPYGGRLDPATGAWSQLPDAPGERTGGWPVDASDGPLLATGGWLYDDAAGSWTRVPRPADSPDTPGPAVWAADELVVVGGADWDLGAGGRGPTTPTTPPTARSVWSTKVWVYRPA